ncbi:replication protein A subunit RPA32 [Lentinula aff. detonsa]|uniref:Replication protein A subunit RPA32 n=1 Tax=Lentinula aff. detonsa TaxID=2804958 RepID=A0AA38KUC4_9AGAR|nr:replication protein A subunit RPA32 [Lentinula aff. detonsa]KAJ3795520.1 replication protein A subunit RPA32 [Lentinula aff. detonsa]
MSQGGGFYQNSSPFNQSQASPGGASEAKRTELSHSVRPLTLAQVNKAHQAHTDAEWTLEGSEVGQVTIIGHVVNISEQTTNFLYTLEDGTGKVEARRWREQNSEEDADKWGDIQVNQVIRVTGHMKAFGSRKYVNAVNIRPSEDPHEIYFHMIEALTVTLSLQNGAPGGTVGQKSPGTASAYTAQSSGIANDDMAEYKHLPPLQREIIKVLLSQPEHDEGGVHVGVVAKAVQKQGMTSASISDALDALMDAGQIYTTSDDAHFQVSR